MWVQMIQLTSWPDQGLAFDVAVHFGTLIAVLAYFRKDLLAMLWAVGQAPAVYAARAGQDSHNPETQNLSRGVNTRVLERNSQTIVMVV